MAHPTEEALAQEAARAFSEAVSIMARLRSAEGCPWDREQTFDSIRKYTLEETYEVLDAIEQRDWPNLREELGDLLLQVLFYAQMAAEPGHFTIVEVVAELNRKLIRRHPHVFGDAASLAAGNTALELTTSGIDAREVLRNWEEIKRAEKQRMAASGPTLILDAVPTSFPPLLEAARLGSTAAKCGFDWPDAEGVFAKLHEEIHEIHQAIAKVKPEETLVKASLNNDLVESISGEVGDLLFTVVNLARHLGVDPELALRSTNRKFRTRFAKMEELSSLHLKEQPSAELEALWQQAK